MLIAKKTQPFAWTVKPKEAIQYLSRTIEKFQIKILEKEKKLEEKQQILLGQKTRYELIKSKIFFFIFFMFDKIN